MTERVFHGEDAAKQFLEDDARDPQHRSILESDEQIEEHFRRGERVYTVNTDVSTFINEGHRLAHGFEEVLRR